MPYDACARAEDEINSIVGEIQAPGFNPLLASRTVILSLFVTGVGTPCSARTPEVIDAILRLPRRRIATALIDHFAAMPAIKQRWLQPLDFEAAINGFAANRAMPRLLRQMREIAMQPFGDERQRHRLFRGVLEISIVSSMAYDKYALLDEVYEVLLPLFRSADGACCFGREVGLERWRDDVRVMLDDIECDKDEEGEPSSPRTRQVRKPRAYEYQPRNAFGAKRGQH